MSKPIIKEDTTLLLDLAHNSNGSNIHKVNSLLTLYKNFIYLTKTSKKEKEKQENYKEALKYEKQLRKIANNNRTLKSI